MADTDPLIPGNPTTRLGLLIKRARKGCLNLSREAFAERIGCSPVTLDSLEAGAPGVGIGFVMAALELIGADSPVIDAVEARVRMLEIAAHPINFPSPQPPRRGVR